MAPGAAGVRNHLRLRSGTLSRIPPTTRDSSRTSVEEAFHDRPAAGRGLTSQQIGARLFIPERTVTTHVTNMLNKLGLSSRIQLASWLAEKQSGGASG